MLAGGLAYASGVSLTPGQDALVVYEAWAHRVRLYPLAGGAGRILRENLPGYPGRINPAPGGYWLAMFALRTQLVEFVLTQRDYVEEMMRTIEPDYWIRPALRGLDSGLEPLQGGQIRKLGVIKPRWRARHGSRSSGRTWESRRTSWPNGSHSWWTRGSWSGGPIGSRDCGPGRSTCSPKPAAA